MKQFLALIAWFAMGLGFAAHAQTNAPVAAPATPTEPTSTTIADNTRYQNHPELLTECAAQVAAFNDKPCDIIFIGDTITANWLGIGGVVWAKNYAQRNALDFGVGGDKTQNVLWRLNNMEVQNLKPKVAVVMIGTENTDNTAHEIADGIKAVLTNTEATFPGVKIILVSLPPNERDSEKMAHVDSLIRSYGDDESVFYLNLVPLMSEVTAPTANGSSWKGLGKDGLHLDATGYQIWADAMEPMLAKLLAGQ
jgi:lysophospholipase L1-like esterase